MLIFDQEVYFRVRKFYGLVFFRVRSFLAFPTVIPYPFYPEVPPEGLWVASQHSKPLGHAGFLKSVRENFRADTHVVAYIGNRNSFRDTNELIQIQIQIEIYLSNLPVLQPYSSTRRQILLFQLTGLIWTYLARNRWFNQFVTTV